MGRNSKDSLVFIAISISIIGVLVALFGGSWGSGMKTLVAMGSAIIVLFVAALVGGFVGKMTHPVFGIAAGLIGLFLMAGLLDGDMRKWIRKAGSIFEEVILGVVALICLGISYAVGTYVAEKTNGVIGTVAGAVCMIVLALVVGSSDLFYRY